MNRGHVRPALDWDRATCIETFKFFSFQGDQIKYSILNWSNNLQNTAVLVMVEGPGNKLKGEKMKATVVGQVLCFFSKFGIWADSRILAGGKISGGPSCWGREQKEHQLTKVCWKEDCWRKDTWQGALPHIWPRNLSQVNASFLVLAFVHTCNWSPQGPFSHVWLCPVQP